MRSGRWPPPPPPPPPPTCTRAYIYSRGTCLRRYREPCRPSGHLSGDPNRLPTASGRGGRRPGAVYVLRVLLRRVARVVTKFITAAFFDAIPITSGSPRLSDPVVSTGIRRPSDTPDRRSSGITTTVRSLDPSRYGGGGKRCVRVVGNGRRRRFRTFAGHAAGADRRLLFVYADDFRRRGGIIRHRTPCANKNGRALSREHMKRDVSLPKDDLPPAFVRCASRVRLLADKQADGPVFTVAYSARSQIEKSASTCLRSIITTCPVDPRPSSGTR